MCRWMVHCNNDFRWIILLSLLLRPPNLRSVGTGDPDVSHRGRNHSLHPRPHTNSTPIPDPLSRGKRIRRSGVPRMARYLLERMKIWDYGMPVLPGCVPDRLGENGMITSIRVKCHRCDWERTYMGTKLALIETARRPVRIKCSKCSAGIRIDRRKINR
jgi:hypothetical protein